MRTTAVMLGTVGAALVLGVAACSATHPGDNASTAKAPQEAGAPNSAYDSAPNASQRKAAVPAKAQPPKLDARSIIYKGEMTVRVKKVTEAAAQASTIATGAGGLVSGDNRSADDTDETADLVLRVPSGSFYGTVERIGKLGSELRRGIHTDDVTEAVVDLDSRIASQKASVERTRALMARADKIGDIVAIEGELATREGELASLQAQKRTLADQVTLSTITVHLVGPSATIAAANAEPATFLTGLAAGWHAFTAAVNGLLVALGAALPFLVVIGIAVAVFLVLRRRRRPAPVPAPATAPEV